MNKTLGRAAVEAGCAGDIDEGHVTARTVEGVQDLKGFFRRPDE